LIYTTFQDLAIVLLQSADEVHYRVHRGLPLDHILSQLNAAHIFTLYLRSVIILFSVYA